MGRPITPVPMKPITASDGEIVIVRMIALQRRDGKKKWLAASSQ